MYDSTALKKKAISLLPYNFWQKICWRKLHSPCEAAWARSNLCWVHYPLCHSSSKDLVAKQHPSNVGTTSSSKPWSSSYSGRYGRGPIDWDKVRVIFIQKVSVVNLTHFLSTRQRQKIPLHVHWMLEEEWRRKVMRKKGDGEKKLIKRWCVSSWALWCNISTSWYFYTMCRNQRLFHHVFRSHCRVQNAVLLNFC